MEERFGPGPAVYLFKGAEALLQDDRPVAMSLFRAAAHASANIGLPRMFVGAFSTRTGGVERSSFSAPGLVWQLEPKARSSCCVLVGADVRYFVRFAEFFYGSLRSKDKKCQVHFHVVNWRPECAPIIAAIAHDGLVSVSSEHWPHRTDYTYFACSRFARAAEIMERLDVPLYIADIDNRCTRSVSATAQKLLSGFDVGFRHHAAANWFPWWTPCGSNSWINNSEKGRATAEWLRGTIAARFEPNLVRRSWWLDQNALNEVRHHAIESGFSVGDLSQYKYSATGRRPKDEIQPLKDKSWSKPLKIPAEFNTSPKPKTAFATKTSSLTWREKLARSLRKRRSSEDPLLSVWRAARDEIGRLKP